jgi:L-asparaginase / beta-aspartyl-peptidase
MNKIAIVVHGGAGPDSSLIQENEEAYKEGLQNALSTGYAVLEKGGSALDAVEAAVIYLEDHPLFNDGKGAAITREGDVQLCASIMEGKELSSGAVASVQGIKNPVQVARAVMNDTNYRYLACEGAVLVAREHQLPVEEASYFMTGHTIKTYESGIKDTMAHHGTVGSVACDQQGNIAAATSTGGTAFSMRGRIADSSVIGCGVYAKNSTCAVSLTGDGEYIIKHVIAHDVSAIMEYRNSSLTEACYEVLHKKLKDTKGDIGIIGVTAQGEICMDFNCDRMLRAWQGSDGEKGVALY